MAASKVYFTTFHTTLEENIQQKLSRLLLTAGMDQIDFRNRYVAIKMHFGEPGNLAYLRPNYAKTVADLVRQLGGKPFLTDCNTLYVGGRKNALDHIESAYVNGFTPYTTGCHIIIADGLKGSDDVAVPVDGEYVKNARIGRALMDADIVISLTHFKGHEATGIGGTIKNLGMGGGSRAGKKEMHADGKPAVNESKCIGCGACHKICAHDAPTIENRKMHIDTNKCVGCGRCIAVCPMDAIEGVYDPNGHLLNCKMAEYAKAVVQGRPSFHISLAMDISPNCDCHTENDVPVIRRAVFAERSLLRQLRKHLRRDVCDHVRQDDAGRDAVDADAGRPQLLCQRLCQGEHRALRGGVARLARRADLPPHGRDVEDAAALPAQHGGQDGVHAVVDAADVHGEQPVPLCLRDLRDQAIVADARVVHEHVRLRQARNGILHSLCICHVAADGLCAGLGRDSGCRRIVFLIEEAHGVACGRKGAHGSRADAPAAAGDQGVTHGVSSSPSGMRNSRRALAAVSAPASSGVRPRRAAIFAATSGT